MQCVRSHSQESEQIIVVCFTAVMLTLCSDTLLRHEATHGQHRSQRANARRVPRACVPCGQAKQRCFGGDPCVRCERKGFICYYGAEQSHRSSSSLSRTGGSPEGRTLSGGLAAQETMLPSSASPTAADPDPIPTGLNPQANLTIPPVPLSIASASSGLLLGEVNHTSWPDLSALPDTISSDYDMFTAYLPHDMRLPDEMTQNFGFPFVWMTEGLGSSSQTQDTLDRSIPNFTMPNDEGLVAPEIIGCANADGDGDGAEHHTGIDFRNARLHGDRNSTHVPLADVCPSFPVLLQDELQSASADLFGYVREVPREAYFALRAFYVSVREYDDMSFPDRSMIHSFVELYFEYFDPHLSFLHPTRMEAGDLSWSLLAAVAAIGVQYSEVKHASSFTAVLKYLLRRAVQNNVSLRNSYDLKMADKIEAPD